MALPVHEQETNIIFMRNSDMAVIYTSDSTTMTKLDKLIALPEGKWKLKETHSLQDTGEIPVKHTLALEFYIITNCRARGYFTKCVLFLVDA